MNPMVSIVIPVYNAGKYLVECIESILCQTYRNFEIVLVDDGSTDDSLAIITKYVDENSQIKVFSQPNGGVISARHTGFLNSIGEWVCFVDADDTIPYNAIEQLVTLIEGTQLVVGAVDTPTHIQEPVTLRQIRDWAVCSRVPSTFYAKLFRRDIITEFAFDIPRTINYGEDMLFFIRVVFSMTLPPRFCNDVVYHYRRNESSLSHSHMSSLDYETVFDTLRIRSIPSADLPDYMNSVIRNKLNGLTGIAYRMPSIICLSDHPYIQQLKEQISQYHYSCNLKDRLILYSRIPFVTKFVAFFSLAITSLRYRLKL